MARTPADIGRIPERVYVLHVHVYKRDESDAAALSWRLKEAVGLTRAIDLEVVDSAICFLSYPSPRTLIGKGWVERIQAVIQLEEISLVVVDGTLSPVQQRNLESAFSCKVIDRTGLILEIFGRRASSAAGVLQVELAALSYQRSRLVRSWTHLERQRGGFGFLGGPGESQLELDRRMISKRMAVIQKQLDQVKRTRTLQRQARQRVPYPIIAFVGYTNAGKSTLFNRLTRSENFAADLLFATLDPTMRRVPLPSKCVVIVSDTVGFISDLPTPLIAAFHATFEEVVEADFLVHVRDIAHPEAEKQKQDVLCVLKQLGLTESALESMIEVCNKVDMLGDESRECVAQAQGACFVSARTGEGCASLIAMIEKFFEKQTQKIHMTIPVYEGRLLAWLHAHGRVKEHDSVPLVVPIQRLRRL